MGETSDVTDVERAVAQAVRGYFDAWAAAQPTDGYAVARLAEADRLLLAAKPTNETRMVVIDRLGIEQLSAGSASVAISGSASQVRGEAILRQDISGPVELRQVEGDWRVALYYRDEWPVAPVLLEGVSARAGALVLSIRLLDFRTNGTWFVVEARNDGADDARFTGARLASHLFVSGLRLLPQGVLTSRVPAGETVFREGALPPLPRTRACLNLQVGVEQSGRRRKTKFEIRL